MKYKCYPSKCVHGLMRANSLPMTTSVLYKNTVSIYSLYLFFCTSFRNRLYSDAYHFFLFIFFFAHMYRSKSLGVFFAI